MFRSILGIVAALAVSGSAHAGFITYTGTGPGQTFIVPTGVTSVNVLAMGGGGGGANGHQGGGGAGYISVGSFTLSPGEVIAISVGKGGTGAADCSGCNTITGLTAGGASSFGALLTAAGGGVVTGVNLGGHNGSSGGGAACNAGSLGGQGGTLGSNGSLCQSGSSMPRGLGAGNYSSLLASFLQSALTPGAGGAGGTGSHAGGGGAGGILVNGAGPNAADGKLSWSGDGGKGFGAGGGAGGFDSAVSTIRYAGGNGANGLIYIEYIDPVLNAVPEPSGIALFGLALAGLVLRRRKAKQA